MTSEKIPIEVEYSERFKLMNSDEIINMFFAYARDEQNIPKTEEEKFKRFIFNTYHEKIISLMCDEELLKFEIEKNGTNTTTIYTETSKFREVLRSGSWYNYITEIRKDKLMRQRIDSLTIFNYKFQIGFAVLTFIAIVSNLLIDYKNYELSKSKNNDNSEILEAQKLREEITQQNLIIEKIYDLYNKKESDKK